MSSSLVNINSITIDSINNKAILENVFWSDISGLRNSYKIISNIDNGEAIINQDIDYQNNAISIIITTPFLNSIYQASDWQLKEPDYIQSSRYLVEWIRNTKFVPELLKSFDKIYLNKINDLIIRLNNIRDYYKIDDELLLNILKTLGFNLDISLSNQSLKAEFYRRTLQEIMFFYKTSGTKFTLDFIGYCHSAFLDLEELYTNDYKTFINSQPDNSYYLTSRINVMYDIYRYQSQQDLLKLKNIFYTLAPTNIMINYFLAELVGSVDLGYYLKESIQYFETSTIINGNNGYLQFDNNNYILLEDETNYLAEDFKLPQELILQDIDGNKIRDVFNNPIFEAGFEPQFVSSKLLVNQTGDKLNINNNTRLLIN